MHQRWHDSVGIERRLTEDEYAAISLNARYVPFHNAQVYLLGRDNELLDVIGYGAKPDAIEVRLRSALD